MVEATSTDQEFICVLKAKIGRISRLLTQEEIAAIAGVSREDVDLFQRNGPVSPLTRRKLLDAYLFSGTINQHLLKRFWP